MGKEEFESLAKEAKSEDEAALTTYITMMYAFTMTVRRTNIYLSDSQLKRMGVLRKKSGGTMTEQVRRAIDLWLDSEERKLVARYKTAVAAKAR